MRLSSVTGNTTLCCYVSRSNISGDIGAIESLRQTCLHRNAAVGITGALDYDNDVFFQALEGETPVVEAMMEKIRLDPRHRDVATLFWDYDRRRVFLKWSMKFVSGIHAPPSEDNPFDYDRLRQAGRAVLDEQIQILAAA